MTPQSLTVRQVMQAEPALVTPDRRVLDALEVMNRKRVGSVVVVHSDGTLAGIFSERDLLRRIADAPPGWRDRPVSDWMTSDPYAIGPEVGWEEAAAMMERLQVRHLPVIEERRVIGILSTRLLMGWRDHVLRLQVEARTRELRQSHDELLARDTELRYNLRAAGRLQNRLLLPQTPPAWPDLGWGLFYTPFDHLGGDYYDFAQPDAEHLGILIADASGHSIAAAMVAVMSRFAFAEVAGHTTQPGEVLSAINERLQGLTDDRFVTAFYGILNRKSRTLTYANAGHPYPFRYSARTGEVVPLSAQGFLLGIMPGEQYREKTVELDAGDRILFYTDGVSEARNEIGEAYGTDRLRDCLLAHGREAAAPHAKRQIAELNDFRGSQPFGDDVTLMVAEFTA